MQLMLDLETKKILINLRKDLAPTQEAAGGGRMGMEEGGGTQEDFDKFKKLINQHISPKQKTCWFPEMPYRITTDKRYVDES